MSFFENQRVARQKTWLLILYLVLAVLGIIAALYFATLFTFFASSGGEHDQSSLWAPELATGVSIATVVVVLVGSLFKTFLLYGGGKKVAESLDGRLISPGTLDPLERKTLNVVEEVSIASGVSIPPVYLLENETGINAFAAGWDVDSAVIGVTRGCIERLSRDELQGVIAHEYSHILNGDMRLNIRLIGVLHGILIIGLAGYFILRTAGTRRRFSGGKKDAAPFAILTFGICLYVIGYVGVFFGKLIKAAVSRQREYLADASAVQFTRQPDGIAGALKKIGGLASGSKIESPHAEESSHMFFANGIRSSFSGFLATHPPLAQRIRRIDPSFDGMFPEARPLPETEIVHAGFSGDLTSEDPIHVSPESITEQVGNPGAQHLQYAAAVLQQLPEILSRQAHDPLGARQIIYALLLDPDKSIREKQMHILQEEEESAILQGFDEISSHVVKLPLRFRIPLIDICLPSLRILSSEQYSSFRKHLQSLANADSQVSLFEYSLHHILLRHVDPEFEEFQHTQPRKQRPHIVAQAGVHLLEVLALAGSSETEIRLDSFRKGMKIYQVVPKNEFDPLAEPSLDVLDRCLTVLVTAEPGLKKHLIAACTACIASDGTITVAEAEMLRLIGDAINCPIPPLLPNCSESA